MTTPTNLAAHIHAMLQAAIATQGAGKGRTARLEAITLDGIDYFLDFKPKPPTAQCIRKGTAEEDGVRRMVGGKVRLARDHQVFSGHNKDIGVLADELVAAILADREDLRDHEENRGIKMTTEPEPQMTNTVLPPTLPLASILDRPGGDTRSLNPGHIVSMAETIAAVGLVQPLVVDRVGHLLAGGHRRAAIRLLLIEDPDERVLTLEAQYRPLPGRIKQELEERTRALTISPDVGALDPVKVHIMDFDAEDEPERALGVEAAENAQRKQYTAQEVLGIYNRLLDAGFVDREGKPREGEKAAKPAVAAIIGRSVRSVYRALERAKQKESVTMTSAGLQIVLSLERRMAGPLKELREWVDESGRQTPDEVRKVLAELGASGVAKMLSAAKEALGWVKNADQPDEYGQEAEESGGRG
ncbi:MAG: ParB N-terminal domain-containing protein [Polyangia bacterium]|jgi:ParB family chromosome partitioning protein|nr:ParB N-terminal domain-containing protein [Polyangia bacterium]